MGVGSSAARGTMPGGDAGSMGHGSLEGGATELTMQREQSTLRCLCLAVSFLLPRPTLAQEAQREVPIAGERPRLRAGALSADFELDGKTNGQGWRAATDSIANLITI